MDYFNCVPNEVLWIILEFVSSVSELGKLQRVNKRFQKEINKTQQLWQNLCLEWIRHNCETDVGMDVLCRGVRASQSYGIDWHWIATHLTDKIPNVGYCLYKGRVLIGSSVSHNGDSLLTDVGMELRQTCMYVGYWENGIRQLADGIFVTKRFAYEGHFSKRGFDGQGTLIDDIKQTRHEGQWRDGFMHGKGTIVSDNYWSFQGEFDRDKICSGTFAFVHGGTNISVEFRPNSEALVHPQVRDCISQGGCSGPKGAPQFVYMCTDCPQFFYCVTCWKDHRGNDHNWTTKWGIYGCESIKSGPVINLTVTVINVRQFSCVMFGDGTVWELRQRISIFADYPMSHCRIITEGRELLDDSATLLSLGLSTMRIYATKRPIPP